MGALRSPLPDLYPEMKSVLTDDGVKRTYLKHRFAEDNHFLSDLLDDEVLYLEPLLVVAAASAGAEMDLPDGALFVACRTCGRLMCDIGNQVIHGWRV